MIAWIASFTLPDWLLVVVAILAIAACGMTAALFWITRRAPPDDFDDYRFRDVETLYREHEGWF